MASKNRQLSTVKWPSHQCGFSLEFYLLVPLSPSLSWILESLDHISAIALFVRNEEVSLELWWLYLQSLNSEVWSAFENSCWLLGQCRKALAMFHSYFLVITNYKYLQRSSLHFCPVTLHCRLQFAVAWLSVWLAVVWVGFTSEVVWKPKEMFSLPKGMFFKGTKS